MGRPDSADGVGRLLERERELAALGSALDGIEADGGGRLVLVEGPAGIGKSALLGALRARAAARGHRVLTAVGSEMERDFGFGIVRRLFIPLLRSLDPAARARLFAGPVALTAAIFGMDEPGGLDLAPTEAALYGLFWLMVGLVETGPLVLSVDDAHWADVASLRFIRYLANRLDGLAVLVAIAARPNEPGLQSEALAGLRGSLAERPIRPPLLTQAATATLVRERIGGNSSAAVEAAFHEATGGNPLLLESLLAEPDLDTGDGGPISPERIAALGAAEVGTGVIERAGRLDPDGPAVVRAAAILGDGADLRALAALAGMERPPTAAILDGLAAADILGRGGERRFAHPLLRTAVYRSIPAATRSEMHARAARLLRGDGSAAEAVAAHLLLCDPGGDAAAIDDLEAAAERAEERGAPESVVTYLRRALPDAEDPVRRGAILHRLGRAGVALRDPSSIADLEEAARLTSDPAAALEIYIELADALALGGVWDVAMATIEAALERFGGGDPPGLLDLEAVRAAGRGYDPATADLYAADLPRLLDLVHGRGDDRSLHLRWVISGLGACRDLPREQILELIGTDFRNWGFRRNGRESSLASQAALALLAVDDLEAAEEVVAAFEDDALRRGSLLAMVSAAGYRAAVEERRGRLQSSEESLHVAIDLLRRNDLSLMLSTTFLHYCRDTIVERRGLESVADLVESLEMPPAFGRTASGAMLLEVRGAVRLGRGDRAGARAALRETEALMRPLGFGPRFSSWRSQLALSLDEEDRAEASRLAEEELRLAREVGSRRAEVVALRALGMLRGGKAGIELVRRSAGLAREGGPPLALARSLAELGAALRRDDQRKESRERLREAFDLAQRCGAERLEDRIEEEMRMAGARPRRRAVSGPESLTPSERRVAVAAAAGGTNREIAQMLFVSLRTVEMHLTNAYLKLGISGRADLTEAMEAAA